MGADLMDFGKHCQICNQVDYLPLQCSSCNGVFCSEHRTQAQHACPAATHQGGVVVCPLCARAIRVRPGQSADSAFEAHHTSPECDPSNYQRVHQKPRCPVVDQNGVRCKEKLTEINTYCCKNCGTRVCLRHRMPDDHQCQQLQAAAQRAAAEQAKQHSVLGRVQGLLQPRPVVPTASASRAPPSGSSSSSSSSSSARPAPAAAAARARARGLLQVDPTNTVKGTAARRMQVPSASAAPELCPQCGVRFATVEQLIMHVDAHHTASQGTGQTGMLVTGLNGCGMHTDEVFRCPHCRYLAADPAQLVAHVEVCQTALARRIQQQQQSADSQGGKGGSNCSIS